jgi:hypothetical protein
MRSIKVLDEVNFPRIVSNWEELTGPFHALEPELKSAKFLTPRHYCM